MRSIIILILISFNFLTAQTIEKTNQTNDHDAAGIEFAKSCSGYYFDIRSRYIKCLDNGITVSNIKLTWPRDYRRIIQELNLPPDIADDFIRSGRANIIAGISGGVTGAALGAALFSLLGYLATMTYRKDLLHFAGYSCGIGLLSCTIGFSIVKVSDNRVKKALIRFNRDYLHK